MGAQFPHSMRFYPAGVWYVQIHAGAVAILTLTIAGACAYTLISSIRWDWRLRGKLTEDEYKAYQSCDKWFGFQDDKYLPTDEQIVWMATALEVYRKIYS